ncbi:lipocalin family protein [Actinokineospora guangxiensis]|uniref:Lipocalin family protein n=1 Tax=Actinokineospora guangxiensis TaxID=1490288 RepID=A0ABW0EUS5_9PSEU
MRIRAILATAVVALAALTLTAAPASAEARPVTPVASVDLTRYQGTWLQLASVPQPFQAQCARNDRANYTLLPSGQVKVINSCTRADGAVFALEGRARSAVPGSTSQLEVSFANIGGEWNFDNPGTYWVIGLDRHYRWAVVGDPTRGSGFVLSRTATPTPAQIAGIATTLLRNGYDLCAFRITAQDGGAPRPIDLCTR